MQGIYTYRHIIRGSLVHYEIFQILQLSTFYETNQSALNESNFSNYHVLQSILFLEMTTTTHTVLKTHYEKTLYGASNGLSIFYAGREI